MTLVITYAPCTIYM